MSATDEATVVIREQLANIDHAIANIDYAIEAKSNEIKELKKARRKLVNSLEALGTL